MWRGKSKSWKKRFRITIKKLIMRLLEYLVILVVVILLLIKKDILKYNNGEPKAKLSGNGIFITAAHIPKSDIDSKYKLLNRNDKDDIAIYFDTTYIGPIYPNQMVNIKGMEGAEIILSSAGSFTVYVSNPEQIASGLSGTRVFNATNTKVIGYVVELLKGGKLRCNSLE